MIHCKMTLYIALCCTGTLVLRSAAHLQKRTFESMCAAAAGGSQKWRFIAELALVLLLFGTLSGDAALLADTGSLTVSDWTGGNPPAWARYGGRIPMLVLVVFLVTPLSLSRQMRGLERAATAGVLLIAVLLVIIVVQSVMAGMPAIASGELPIWTTAVSPGEIPEALSVLSFAFYTTPMLLPLLSELPEGPRSVDLMCSAVQIVTLLVAFCVYAVVGIFAAARWGLETEGDCMVNSWLPGRWAGVLDFGMAVYLSISMAPMAITMRYIMESMTAGGELIPRTRAKDALNTIFGIGSATAVAVAWPRQAEKLFALTGATAVSLVSYVLPVLVHFRLYFRPRRHLRLLPIEEEQYLGGMEHRDPTRHWLLEDAALLGSSGAMDDASSVARRQSCVLPEQVVLDWERRSSINDQEADYSHISDLTVLSLKRKMWAILVNIVTPLLILIGGIVAGGAAVWFSLAKL